MGEGPVLHYLRRSQGVPAVDDGHLRGESGQEQCFLDGGVSASDHDELLASEEEPVARRARGDAVPEEPSFGFDPQHPGGCSRGDDERAGPPLLIARPHAERCGRKIHPGCFLMEELGFEPAGLLLHPFHQLGSEDGVREPGEVLHLGREHQLSTGVGPLEHERRQIGPGGVQRRGQARRAGPQDDYVTNVHGWHFPTATSRHP